MRKPKHFHGHSFGKGGPGSPKASPPFRVELAVSNSRKLIRFRASGLLYSRTALNQKCHSLNTHETTLYASTPREKCKEGKRQAVRKVPVKKQLPQTVE